MIHRTAALAVLLALGPGLAHGQTLRERQAMQAADTRYGEAATSMASACGKEISARIDWQTFTSADFASGNSLNGWCEPPVDAIRNLCSSTLDGGLGKQAVVEKIDAVVCQRGPERTLRLEGGTLTYTITFDSFNDGDFVSGWLLDNL